MLGRKVFVSTSKWLSMFFSLLTTVALVEFLEKQQTIGVYLVLFGLLLPLVSCLLVIFPTTNRTDNNYESRIMKIVQNSHKTKRMRLFSLLCFLVMTLIVVMEVFLVFLS
jgi:hypothetical protein